MLYVGSQKRKVKLNGVTYNIKLFEGDTPIVNTVRLLSSEGYVLKDKNNLYLIPKDGE